LRYQHYKQGFIKAMVPVLPEKMSYWEYTLTISY